MPSRVSGYTRARVTWGILLKELGVCVFIGVGGSKFWEGVGGGWVYGRFS